MKNGIDDVTSGLPALQAEVNADGELRRINPTKPEHLIATDPAPNDARWKN